MKRQKGRVSTVPKEEIKIEGDYAIVSQGEARITGKQIETMIMTMKRTMPSEAKVKTRIQGHLAVTEKPLEVRMGKGKGSIAKRVARVRVNTVIMEVKKGGEPESKYMAGMRVVGSKLPVRYKLIKRRKRREKKKEEAKGGKRKKSGGGGGRGGARARVGK